MNKNFNNGKLFVIESGTDGSGKKEQTKLLFKFLEKENRKVKKISFPNYQSLASMPLKMYLNGELDSNPENVNPYAASTFYAIDRFFSYFQDWKKDYNNDYIIISDRYTTSNMVHQGEKFENDIERDKYLDWLCDLEYNKYQLPTPTKVIFLDLLPELSEKLRENRPNKINNSNILDIHEKNKEYLKKCYENSLKIAQKYDWEIIKCYDGDKIRTIEEISEEIQKIIKKYI